MPDKAKIYFLLPLPERIVIADIAGMKVLRRMHRSLHLGPIPGPGNSSTKKY